MEGYTGEGEPPCIVMTLRAVSDETTPPDLSLPVTLTGVREPNIITLERWLEPRSDNIQPDVSLPTKPYGQYTMHLVCITCSKYWYIYHIHVIGKLHK